MRSNKAAIMSVYFTLFIAAFVQNTLSSTTTYVFLDNVADYPSNAIRGALLRAFPSLSPPLPTPPSPYRPMKTDIQSFDIGEGTGSGAAGAGVATTHTMMGQANATSTDKKTKTISKVYGCVGIQNQVFDMGTPVCETTIEEKLPKLALANDGNHRIIVNDPLIYQQTIFTQTCKYKNKPCEIEADLSSGYKSVCVQSYTTVKMLAFVNGTLSEDNFNLPVSCDCYLKRFYFYSRG